MLKSFLKLVGLLFALAIFFVVGFYFWAGRATYPTERYNEIAAYTEPLEPKDTFTAVTYNIGYLSGMTNNLPTDRPESLIGINLDSAIALFQALKPDFVGFQEIDIHASRSYFQNQPKAIAQEAGYATSAVAINWDARYVPFPYWPPKHHFGKIVSGQAVLSQYTIDFHERILFTKPVNDPFWRKRFYTDRLAQVCKIDIGRGIPLVLINIHLEAFDGETRLIQAKHVLRIYEAYKKFPVVLMGDFNARLHAADVPKEEQERTISLFLDAGFQDATFKEDELEQAGGFTFSSASPYKRIDYIFCNDKIQVLDARVITEAGTISDHLPVWVKFTVP